MALRVTSRVRHFHVTLLSIPVLRAGISAAHVASHVRDVLGVNEASDVSNDQGPHPDQRGRLGRV